MVDHSDFGKWLTCAAAQVITSSCVPGLKGSSMTSTIGGSGGGGGMPACNDEAVSFLVSRDGWAMKEAASVSSSHS